MDDEGSSVFPVLSAVETAPGRIRGGVISALILGGGLAAAIAGGLGHAYLRKDITVTAAGRSMHRTTYTQTVAQALEEAGVTPAPTDEVFPPLHARVTEGMTLVVRAALPVMLVADGQHVVLESAAATVGDLLGRRGIVLDETDKVYPDLDIPLARGMTIRVVRIEHRVVAEQQRIPFDVRASQDPGAPRGMLHVIHPGRSGLKERLYTITVADGAVVGKELVGERLIRTPLDRVVTVGTLVRLAVQGPFAGREYLDMVATAYSPYCCWGVDDITSTGMKAGYGVVAVDPTVIRLGSRLYVEGYGYAIAGDVGGRIKGLRIDLGFNTKREALVYGIRPVRVYVIETK